MPRSPSPPTPTLMMLPTLLTFLLLALLATLPSAQTPALAAPLQPTGSIAWGTCSQDVYDYFSNIFPDWSLTSSGRRRRRAQQQAAATATASSDGTLPVDPDLITHRFAGATRSRTPLHSGRAEHVAQTHPFAAHTADAASPDAPALDASAPPAALDNDFTASARNLAFDSAQSYASLDRRDLDRDAVRPATNASMQFALASASGCKSCQDGCCTDADIIFQCGSYQVPIDYEDLSKGNMTLSVYRVSVVGAMVPALGSPSRRQLWLLQGGPGGSGLSILFLTVDMLIYAEDIIVPDHRGTGASAPLTCSRAQSGTTSSIDDADAVFCAAESSSQGRPFNQYTATHAAHDLGALITSSKADTTPAKIYVFGISYGTYWAQRFMQLYPGLANKIVIEGIVDKDTTFNDFALGSQSAGARFLDKCALDTDCNSRVPNGVTGLMQDIVQAGDANQCTILLLGKGIAQNQDLLLQIVQALLYRSLVLGLDGPYNTTTNVITYVDFRVFTLSFFYRWSICTSTSSDAFHSVVASFTWFISSQGGLTGRASANPAGSLLPITPAVPPQTALTADNDTNNLLYSEVVYSELFTYPVLSLSSYASRFANVQWGLVDAYDVYVNTAGNWSLVAYVKDALYDVAPPNLTGSLLVVNGELDGQTPRAQAYRAAGYLSVATGQSQYLVVQPDAGHHATGVPGCALNAAKAFLNDQAVTTSCGVGPSDAALPLQRGFTIHPDYATVLSGSTDVWTGGIVPGFCTSSSSYTGCVRCFDYCLLVAAVVKDACNCLSKLHTCLAKLPEYQASNALAVNECYNLQALYNQYSFIGQDGTFNAGGVCLNSCEVTVQYQSAASSASWGAAAAVAAVAVHVAGWMVSQ